MHKLLEREPVSGANVADLLDLFETMEIILKPRRIYKD